MRVLVAMPRPAFDDELDDSTFILVSVLYVFKFQPACMLQVQVCTYRHSFWLLQAIKNWRRERPGNEANDGAH